MKFSNILTKKNRILLKELVITDFKLRYQGSALGYLWSILKPLFLFAILYVVFDQFLKLGRDIEHFPVYLLLGIVLWNFFSEATNLGLQSIVGRGDLLRKINFPKYIIVVSATISSLINLAINLCVVVVFMLINQVDLRIEALLIIPLIIELYIFSLAVAFFLAALNVKFRDTGYLWEIFMQALFYATPIIYPISMVLAQSVLATKIIMLSPVAQIIQDARHALVTTDSVTTFQLIGHTPYFFIPFAIVVLSVIFATIFFKKNSKKFAEEI